jgi:hypothetical protein
MILMNGNYQIKFQSIHNKNMKNHKIVQLALLLIIFISIVPVIIVTYQGIISTNIYFHHKEYKKGVFILDSLDCGSGHGGEDFKCYGFGKINNIIHTKINLGNNPNTISISGNYANLNQKKYLVFYRENGKQTILRLNKEKEINVYKYLKKAIFELLYPIIIFPIIIFLYIKIKKTN